MRLVPGLADGWPCSSLLVMDGTSVKHTCAHDHCRLCTLVLQVLSDDEQRARYDYAQAMGSMRSRSSAENAAASVKQVRISEQVAIALALPVAVWAGFAFLMAASMFMFAMFIVPAGTVGLLQMRKAALLRLLRSLVMLGHVAFALLIVHNRSWLSFFSARNVRLALAIFLGLNFGVVRTFTFWDTFGLISRHVIWALLTRGWALLYIGFPVPVL
jgi:hypothetical protein